MRALLLSWMVLVAGCDASGTQAGGPDATSDAPADGTAPDVAADDGGPGPTGDAAGDDASDATLPSCAEYEAGIYPSQNCVFAGSCPLDCLNGTASAYACAAAAADLDSAVAAYPGVFTLPTDTVHVYGYQPLAYPWEAGAFLSCAPLACVRWSVADHVQGGSAWPGDPCGGEAGAAIEAWACPPAPGVVPPGSGCINAGDGQRIGGDDSGVPVNGVWCCPPQPEGGPGDAAGD
jgi:hypothetical protein